MARHSLCSIWGTTHHESQGTISTLHAIIITLHFTEKATPLDSTGDHSFDGLLLTNRPTLVAILYVTCASGRTRIECRHVENCGCLHDITFIGPSRHSVR